MKDELGGKIKTSFPAIQAKAYSCLTDDSSEDKKKGTKMCGKNLKIIKPVQKQRNLIIK